MTSKGPDIAVIAAAIGDPARANILLALMSGKALTATELAFEAGVTKQTTSGHIKTLTELQLISMLKSGRHKYFRLFNDDVAEMIEAISGFAAKRGLSRVRTGPKDKALCKARVCYNHLAGDMGVYAYDQMITNGLIFIQGDSVGLTPKGTAFLSNLGLDIRKLTHERRPLCKSCLDWSARRSHLAGAVGAAMLTKVFELGWAKQIDKSRIVTFSTEGEHRFYEWFSTPINVQPLYLGLL